VSSQATNAEPRSRGHPSTHSLTNGQNEGRQLI
jgi:hypothetical protein